MSSSTDYYLRSTEEIIDSGWRDAPDRTISNQTSTYAPPDLLLNLICKSKARYLPVKRQNVTSKIKIPIPTQDATPASTPVVNVGPDETFVFVMTRKKTAAY